MNILKTVAEAVRATPDKDRPALIEAIRAALHAESPRKEEPIDYVRWVPIGMVEPNDYNPNAVPKKEMGLLAVSIRQDGYTQPIVTIWNPERKKYVIVDGFHRYTVALRCQDVSDKVGGMLPIVVINKSINDRMASTVRHNRARGEHSIGGMSKLVFAMLKNGWSDVDICNKVGVEPDELLKLKHITGFSALFKDATYSKAWETKEMIRFRIAQEKGQ